MKKKIIIGIGFLTVLSIFLFVYPYNGFDYIMTDGKVRAVLAESTVREKGMGSDYSEIVKIKYLGSDHYFVKTEKSDYVVKLKTRGHSFDLSIYEHQLRIQRIAE